jgi:hypothetical protein
VVRHAILSRDSPRNLWPQHRKVLLVEGLLSLFVLLLTAYEYLQKTFNAYPVVSSAVIVHFLNDASLTKQCRIIISRQNGLAYSTANLIESPIQVCVFALIAAWSQVNGARML